MKNTSPNQITADFLWMSQQTTKQNTKQSHSLATKQTLFRMQTSFHTYFGMQTFGAFCLDKICFQFNFQYNFQIQLNGAHVPQVRVVLFIYFFEFVCKRHVFRFIKMAYLRQNPPESIGFLCIFFSFTCFQLTHRDWIDNLM